MQALEFGQRFLNYKAHVEIIQKQSGTIVYKGMFMDAPYRILRFADVVRVEIQPEAEILKIYITGNSPMYFNTQSHFISDNVIESSAM